MILHVSNGERFDRKKRRYVGFFLVIITIIGLSLWKGNIIGVVILFVILGAYFYYNIISNQIITIKAEDEHIVINNRIFIRNNFKAYCIEIEKKTKNIKNIVLITERSHLIYTIHDKDQNIREFLRKIDEHLELIGEYNQTSLEKISRLLKL